MSVQRECSTRVSRWKYWSYVAVQKDAILGGMICQRPRNGTEICDFGSVRAGVVRKSDMARRAEIAAFAARGGARILLRATPV